MLYRPEKIWLGQDVFIIGGGNSLREENFDWSLLLNENTIGCNNAFRLGPEICKVCVFCDDTFIFEKYQEGGRVNYKPKKDYYDVIKDFPNLIITNHDKLKSRPETWLKYIPRQIKGLSDTPDFLCYNFNTGAAAINLALLYGAKNIYLLGFDMKLSKDKKSNWHNFVNTNNNQDVYERMILSMGHVKRDLKKFPDSNVYNINNDTKLTYFPIIKTEVFWNERKQKCVA